MLNAAKAETASAKSKLRANDAALLQATGDLEQLHTEAGQLRQPPAPSFSLFNPPRLHPRKGETCSSLEMRLN